MYFERRFPPEFNITANPDLINAPVYIQPRDLKRVPAPGQPLYGEDFKRFVDRTTEEIAHILGLKKSSVR
jgi:threonine synthase